jgi:UDPglucose 6-dehydrogenase
MKICIVGTGYVGLVTGACFAEMGNEVWCVDVDEVKISNLKAAILPIYEPGLRELVEKNFKTGHLRFITDIEQGIEDALFCFITVGTPSCEDGSADLSNIFAVARTIGQCMNQYLIVVTKSTIPVGTTQQVRDIISQELKARAREDVGFDVVFNPEFLKEGAAVDDFMRPDRVVIGTENVGTAEQMKQLYKPFVCNQNPILLMDTKSAEITKYAANVMLAARISFMNEIAQLCDTVGGDITKIRMGIAADHRIGGQFLYAGAGYGGSCFPKDVKELIHTGHQSGIEMAIATAVHKVNERQKQYLVDMIRKRFGEKLSGMKFAIWGLAFKPQTDDMREAPSLVIVQSLINMGANIIAFDPQAMEQARRVFENHADNIQYVDNMMDAVNAVDALVLITDWQQFRQPDFSDMKTRMHQLVVFDGRNQYEFEEMKQYGFEYYCIGRNCWEK